MSATLDSEAAFIDRAEQMGVERWIINKFKAKKFAMFGKLAFAFAYAPQNADDTPLKNFLGTLLEEPPSEDQLATLRRLFFEAHTMALTDVRHRAEATPDPSQATRKMPTAERVARQTAQEKRLGGIIFNPNTIPSNHLVDLFVEMVENGILTYVKPEACCSRAQEVELVRKDTTVSTDAAGLLKLGTKMSDPSCEANTEMKLRAAWQRRSLAMDLAGLASFDVMESWVQFLFQQLLRDQPRGFSKISLQQILDCDRNLFVQASHKTMGKLAAGPDEDKPLDDVLEKLRDSNEILQYLAPLPASRVHEVPAQPSNPKGPKAPKVDKGGKGALSRAAIQAGFSVLSVDHDATHAQAKLKAIQLEKDEKQLHEQLPGSLKKVLQGKKLLLWRALLEKYGYDDLEVFKFMSEGVHLSGKHDTPACYPEKIRPATLTQEDLERSAVWRRKACNRDVLRLCIRV
eukprot:s3690_g4.t1